MKNYKTMGECMKYLKFFICQFILGTALFAFSGQEEWSTVATYDNSIPENIKVNEKYKGGHPEVLDYVFVRGRVANLRDLPSTKGKVIGKYGYDTKLKALKKVLYYGNYWFFVEDSKGKTGYISANLVRKRVFRFQKALDKINELEKFVVDQKGMGRELASTSSYVPNPNNQNFKRAKDKYGTSLDQSSIGRSVVNNEEIYIPDRSILSVVQRGKTTSRVKVANIPEELIISNSTMTKNPVIQEDFSKVVAIDVSNQNMIVFEKNRSKEWEVISYVYSKTGIESQLGFETPKGFFTAPMVKYVMPYNSETGDKQGYARYAMRFSGGGYLHGTPINYDEEINKEFFMKQKEKTLGTFTGTRKCIRTTEEHAKFLFDWVMKTPNKKQNEQRLTENVMFIIF